MNKRLDFKWRYQPSSNSLLSRMLDYINNRDYHPAISKTEMILKALSAFYIPQFLTQQDITPQTQAAIHNSLQTLYNHFLEMCAKWNVNPASFGHKQFNNSGYQLPVNQQNLLPEEEDIDDDIDTDEESELKSFIERTNRMFSGLNLHSYTSESDSD